MHDALPCEIPELARLVPGAKLLAVVLQQREAGLAHPPLNTILADAEDLSQPTADDIFERLLMHGYLYEVEGELRLTEP